MAVIAVSVPVFYCAFTLFKKIINSVEVFVAITCKRCFFLFFLNFARSFYRILLMKGFFYHSVRINAADLLTLHKRMIVLDSKVSNLL